MTIVAQRGPKLWFSEVYAGLSGSFSRYAETAIDLRKLPLSCGFADLSVLLQNTLRQSSSIFPLVRITAGRCACFL